MRLRKRIDVKKIVGVTDWKKQLCQDQSQEMSQWIEDGLEESSTHHVGQLI